MAVTLGVELGVQLHLKKGAGVDARDDKGQTPLIIAASKGYLSICAMLLERGADPGIRTHSGVDAAQIATERGHHLVVALLQEHALASVAPPGSSPVQILAPDPVESPPARGVSGPFIRDIGDDRAPSESASKLPENEVTSIPESVVAPPCEAASVASQGSPASGEVSAGECSGASSDDTLDEEPIPPLSERVLRDAIRCRDSSELVDVEIDAGDFADDLGPSDWTAELVRPAPTADPTVLTDALAIHGEIGRHLPIDIDEDWSDIDIELPEVLVRRRRRIDSDEQSRWLGEAEDLILLGARDGEIPRRLIDGLAPVNVDSEWDARPDQGLMLELVLGDLGIRVLDDEDAPWDPLPLDGDAEDRYWDFLAEAGTYLRTAISSKSDPLLGYLANLSGIKVLNRAEESAIGKTIEEGRRRVSTGILRSSSARAELASWLNTVDSGRTRWEELFSEIQVSAEEEEAVDASDGHGVPDEHDSEADANYPSVLAERIGHLLDACSKLGRIGTDPIPAPALELAGTRLDALGLRPEVVGRLVSFVRDHETDDDIRAELIVAADAVLGARHKLFHHNQRLVYWIARKYQRSGLPLMDLVQEGSLGLLRATDKFDYRRETKFSTYAVWWIRQSITRAIDDQSHLIRIPVHVMENLRKIRRSQEGLTTPDGHGPSPEAIASALALDLVKVKRLLKISIEELSLDELEANGIDPFEFLRDRSPTPEVLSESRSLVAAVHLSMVGLLPREHRIVCLRFGIGTGQEHTLEEIGQMYNVTRERIRQIEAKALRKLQHPTRSRPLRHLL